MGRRAGRRARRARTLSACAADSRAGGAYVPACSEPGERVMLLSPEGRSRVPEPGRARDDCRASATSRDLRDPATPRTVTRTHALLAAASSNALATRAASFSRPTVRAVSRRSGRAAGEMSLVSRNATTFSSCPSARVRGAPLRSAARQPNGNLAEETSPGAAALSRRAATFAASPLNSPIAVALLETSSLANTSPVFTPVQTVKSTARPTGTLS